MSFSIQHGPMEGTFLVQPRIFGDDRGCFLETYNERDFSAGGIGTRFVQDNQSKSRKGVVRGLHFQKRYPQGKLVRVINGEVFDVAVDLRAGSPTFGKWHGLVLSGIDQCQFYIPAGFAHGFLVLSEEAVLAYKCTDFYHPEDEDGIRWDDPVLAIEWPDLGAMTTCSGKDSSLPLFNPSLRYFDVSGGPA